MKDRRMQYLIIGLLIFTVLLTGAYALLGGNLNITGTATGVGDFKIEFSSYNISNEEKANASLNTDRTSLTINADLSYPGDTVTIDFIIKNTGSLAAIVDNLIINDNSDEDFTISIVGLNDIEGTILGVNETTSGSVVVTWNSSSTTAEPESVNFSVTIDYLQAT